MSQPLNHKDNFQPFELPPDLLAPFDNTNKDMLSKTCNLSVSRANKLQLIDAFMTTQSGEVQKPYRKWRFKFDKDTVYR